MGLILFILLILLLVGSFPTWPYSRGWGYNPAGVFFVILLVFLLLVFMGEIALVAPHTAVVPATTTTVAPAP